MILVASTGPGRKARSCLLGLLAVAVAVSIVVIPAPSARAEGGNLRTIGTFPRPEGAGGRANGEMIFRSSTRRAYQAVRTSETMVTEYDADSMKRLRSVRLPQFAVTLTAVGESAWLWTIDDAGGRLFAIVRTDGFGQFDYSLVALDLKTLRVTAPRLLYDTGRRAPLALSYHAAGDRLYMLSKSELSIGRDLVFLEERRADGALVWEEPVLSCTAIGDHLLAPIVARSALDPTKIFLNCYMRNGVQSQVVRVTLGQNGRVADEETFPSVPRSVSGVVFDPGSDRIFFLATNSNAGRGAWVFDGRAGKFLGVIASGDARDGEDDYAMGLDPATGRIYIQTSAGFLVADGRRTPLDAGYIFRDLAGPGRAPIHVDSRSRRVFAPDPKWPAGDGWPRRYLVLADEIPLSFDPPAPEPDANTVDVDEKQGLTDATFAGAARAFAVRSLMTGGVQRAAWNGAVPDFEPKQIPFVWPAIESVPVSNANREVIAARVTGVELSTGSADGRAFAGTADDGTLRDLNTNGIEWPYDGAECHNSGGEEERNDAEGASATCDAGTATASAWAATSRIALPTGPGDVVAETASSSGRVWRDPELGLVSRSLATVRGLSLFGKVRIGELRAEAVSRAHGRKGTAKASYERSFIDVWIDEDADGEGDYTCDQCDPRELLVHINRALAGVASVSMPEPDGAFYPNGSPGGYQAVVRRNLFEAYTARSLNDDDVHEVPGFEVVFYSDGRAGRTRHILQFAAVLAETHYGIYLLPGSAPDERPAVPIVLPRRSIVAPPPVSPAEPKAVSKTETIVERIVKRIATGYHLFGVGLRRASLLAVLWIFLLLPGYLIVRRRMIT